MACHIVLWQAIIIHNAHAEHAYTIGLQYSLHCRLTQPAGKFAMLPAVVTVSFKVFDDLSLSCIHNFIVFFRLNNSGAKTAVNWRKLLRLHILKKRNNVGL